MGRYVYSIKRMDRLKSVVLEHAEILTPFGNLAETIADLLAGESAIRAGPCFGVEAAFASFPDVKFRDIFCCISYFASRIPFPETDPASTIFIYCAAKGDIRAIEDIKFSGASTAPVSPLLDMQARSICESLAIAPAKIIAVSNACASGAVGIETATEYLRAGTFTHAILFGFDCLSRFTATGFFSLGALSPTGARPFDARRSGLTMGEGAACAVLSFRESFSGDIVIAGAGSSNDANHRTGPSRTGDGLIKASRAALFDAAMSPGSVGAVKCHGTATPFNDAMEAKALYSLFGHNCPPCVSLKGALGHLSGAGSLAETIIAAECLKRRMLPPTKGYEQHGVDEPVKISSDTQRIEKPSVLCLAAGFSGLNTAVVIKEHP